MARFVAKNQYFVLCSRDGKFANDMICTIVYKQFSSTLPPVSDDNMSVPEYRQYTPTPHHSTEVQFYTCLYVYVQHNRWNHSGKSATHSFLFCIHSTRYIRLSQPYRCATSCPIRLPDQITTHDLLGPKTTMLLLRTTTLPLQSISLESCKPLNNGDIVISRTNFIIAATLCTAITATSLLVLVTMLYRAWARRRQIQAARKWGRKSTYNRRISFLRKAVDDGVTQQFSGCLYNDIPENPFLNETEERPVELGCQRKVCEAPAVVPLAKLAPWEERKLKAFSLFFDHGHGVWMPKR